MLLPCMVILGPYLAGALGKKSVSQRNIFQKDRLPYIRPTKANRKKHIIFGCLDCWGHCLISMGHFWVRRGPETVLSNSAPSSLNMSSYRAIWTHFRSNSMILIRKYLVLAPGTWTWPAWKCENINVWTSEFRKLDTRPSGRHSNRYLNSGDSTGGPPRKVGAPGGCGAQEGPLRPNLNIQPIKNEWRSFFWAPDKFLDH